MKNDIDDLLNSVFGSRTLRTGGQAAGREKPETPRLTLEPEPKQPSPRGRSPQRRTAPGRPAAPSRGASREDARPKADVPVIDFDAIGKQPPGTDLHAAPDFAAIERRAANAARELQALARGSTHGCGAGRGHRAPAKGDRGPEPQRAGGHPPHRA